MKIFADAIRVNYDSFGDVESHLEQYLNKNKGQLAFFNGSRQELILSMAAEELLQEGVTVRCLDDPVFKAFAESIKNTVEAITFPKRERRAK